jgi:hypothetical protein
MTNVDPGGAQRRPLLIVGLSIVGVLLVVVAIIYFSKTAGALPAFFPGHQASSASKHIKHGLASIVLAALCFLGVWFNLGTRTSRG